jgi:hypothetical protein
MCSGTRKEVRKKLERAYVSSFSGGQTGPKHFNWKGGEEVHGVPGAGGPAAKWVE